MKLSTILSPWTCAAIVLCSLVVHQASSEGCALPEDKPISWDSPRMHAVEARWQKLQDTYERSPEMISGNPGKDKYAQLERMIDHLLGTSLSDRDLRQLIASIGEAPNRGFTDRVVEYIVRTFVDAGDRESVVNLLSRRCPGRVGGYDNIEFYLASRGRKLKDPMLVLGEAYAISTVPEARRNLAAAVRRGFAGHGIRVQDDADCVKQAMRWYESEKDQIVVNDSYWRNEMAVPLEMYEKDRKLYDKFPAPLKREPLFKKTVPAHGSPRQKPESGHAGPKPVHGGTQKESQMDSGTGDTGLASLKGTWEVLEARESGEPVPQERIRGLRFVVSKEFLAFVGPGDNKPAAFRMRLGPPHQPRAIDLLSMPAPVSGTERAPMPIDELQQEITPAIYELKGDALRFCLPARGTTQRPTSFATEKGSRETSLLLRRVKE